MSNYFASVAAHLGGWPTSYLVLDAETQGLTAGTPETLPLELGWCWVVRGEIHEQGSQVLDWAGGLYDVDVDWLARTIQSTGESMRSRGLNYRFTTRYIREVGQDPRESLRRLSSLMASARADGHPIVGHNLFRFDAPLIAAACRRVAQGFAPVTADEILDTMLVERGKAASRPPKKDETRLSWYESLVNVRKVSNLGHCARLYNLPDVDESLAHTALADCLTTHKLVEAMGVLARQRVLIPQDDAPLFRSLA